MSDPSLPLALQIYTPGCVTVSISNRLIVPLLCAENVLRVLGESRRVLLKYQVMLGIKEASIEQSTSTPVDNLCKETSCLLAGDVIRMEPVSEKASIREIANKYMFMKLLNRI